MNVYPVQLRRIADLCAALNEIAVIVDHEPQLTGRVSLEVDGTPFGWLVDEVGGSWSWQPPGDQP